MKKGIHPKYYKDAVITCACGNVIKTGSTKPKMEIEICGACHPFYTGKKKVIDSAGQVDRYKKRIQKAAQIKETKPNQKKTRVKDPNRAPQKVVSKKKIKKSKSSK